jgi:hypothetical protein
MCFVWFQASGGKDEVCALLEKYAAYRSNTFPTFRDNLSVPSLRVNNPVDRQDASKRRQWITTIRCVSSQKSADWLPFDLTFPLRRSHFNRSRYAEQGRPSVRVRFQYPSWRWLAHLFPRVRPERFTCDTPTSTAKCTKLSDDENSFTI